MLQGASDMILIITTIILIVGFLWLTLRFFLGLALLIVRRWAQIDIKVGQIGFLKLKNISVYLQPTICLEIEKICFSSYYANKKYRALLIVCFCNLSLNMDFTSFQSYVLSRSQKKSSSHNKKFEFLKFMPIAKLIGIDFSHISVLITEGPISNTSVQLRVDKLTPTITTLSSQRVVVYLCLDSCRLQLVHAAVGVRSEPHSQICLASASSSQTLEAHLNPKDIRSIEAVKISMSSLSWTSTEDFLRHLSRLNALRNSKALHSQETSLTKTGSRLLALMPKKLHLDVSELEVVLEKAPAQRDLVMTATLLQFDTSHALNYETLKLMEGQASFVLKGASVKSNTSTLVALNQLKTTVLVDEIKAVVDMQLAGGYFGYDQGILKYWIMFFSDCRNLSQLNPDRKLPGNNQTDSSQTYHENFGQDHRISDFPEPSCDQNNLDMMQDAMVINSHERRTSSSKKDFLMKVFGSRMIKLSLDAVEVSISVIVDSYGLEMGSSHWKTLIIIKPIMSADSSLRLEDVQYELDVTMAYCRLANNNIPLSQLNAKHHVWNTLFYSSVVIAKGNRFSWQWNHDVMIDSLRLETSFVLLFALDTIANALLGQWHISRGQQRDREIADAASHQEFNRDPSLESRALYSSRNSTSKAAVCHVQLTNFNLFLCCENKAAAMIRVDTAILQQRGEKVLTTLSEVKATYFVQMLQIQPVFRSADLQDFVMYVRSVETELMISNKHLKIKLPDGVFLSWTMALHMCFHQTFLHLTSVVEKYPALLKRKTSDKSKESSNALGLAVSVGGRIQLEMHLQNNHRVFLAAVETSLNQSHSQTNFICPHLDIFFDGHNIFVLEGIHICSLDNSDRFRAERASAKTLELATNRAWTVAFDKFKIIFPFEYNFAECLQELKNVNKWRKLIFKKSPSEPTNLTKIPPDLLITAKTVLVQLSDNPFEVKLRHIYETLCDVGVMSENRQMAMDQRIEELQRTQGIIPAKKIQELYSLLSQKTSEDYIQRISCLYEEAPLRTSLFCWTINRVEIFALADTSYSGKENILKHMKEIDPDSPLPDDDDLQFVSLFCRSISASAEHLQFQLRDFPHAMLDVSDLHVWGRLIGAEPLGAPKARRNTVIDMGNLWGNLTTERNLPQIKFFHDFSADVVSFNMAYGPCWEPTMAQVNLALNKVSRPSVDPSPPLPFWDKFRLLLHGRLTISIQETSWLYHASLDPYNTTEFFDWTWSDFLLDWTNAKWILHGNLDVFSKTASKYNDCRLLHLPNLRLSIRLDWLCAGDPNDHHSVMPCAPEKVLEYNVKDYDSYRLFRSKNFNIHLSFEIRSQENDEENIPCCLFFASTLRWIDKIKMCLNHVSRPIKRGPLFHTVGHRKKSLSHHIQNIRVAVDFSKFELCYWVSFSKQIGAMFESDQITMDVSLRADRTTINDGLKRKPNRNWCIRQFKSHLNNGIVWLCCTNHVSDKKKERSHVTGSMNKSFLLSVDEVSYERREALDATEVVLESSHDSETPLHKVKVFNLRASWTPSNRNVAFNLYDGYSKAQMLKANLLSDILKGFKVDTSQTPKKNSRLPQSEFSGDGRSVVSNPFSPQLRSQSGPVYCLLQQLIKEAGSVAVHEELSGKVIDLESLQGIGAYRMDDILCTNWKVELVNSQVMLKGCETSGYVIACAAQASLLSCSRCPVWSDGQLKTKTTLNGSLEGMQYYATVDSGAEGLSQNVRWLSKEDVEDNADRQWDDDIGLSDMAGSGQSVGGVVSDPTDSTSEEFPIQLQRIISRCGCQFFCAWYGEAKDEHLQDIPVPLNDVESDMMKRQEGVDAFTLLHQELKICTNSLQYATVLDIVNNLLLYVDPKKKELTEKLQDMRFKRHLSSVEDQRTPISQRQDSLRKLVSSVRALERELYRMQRKFEEDQENKELCKKVEDLQKELEASKDQVNTLNEELSLMVSCYKESRLQVMSQRLSSKTEKSEITVRCIDLYFKHAEWRMTEADGQIGIADLVLSNFLYTNRRTADFNKEKKDSGSQRLTDSGSHHLELGWFKVTNLLPNSVYTDVLVPQHPADGVFPDRQVAFRVLCQFTSPVGGISVKKHFEINVAPLSIQLTTRFYTTVMSFFFPGKPVDSDDEMDSDTASIGPSSTTHLKTKEEKKEKKKSLSRSAKLLPSSSNDIDRMKERAAKNNLFVYIKIPEVPLQVSYKSENEKLIPNIHDFRLVLPLLEYHNQTWMWHDLAMAIKSDCKKVIVRQVVKHKLHIRSRALLPDVFLSEMEEDEGLDMASKDARKAQVLLGATLMDAEDKPSKKKNFMGKHSK